MWQQKSYLLGEVENNVGRLLISFALSSETETGFGPCSAIVSLATGISLGGVDDKSGSDFESIASVLISFSS